MQNAKMDDSQAGINIAGKNINNLRYADDAILMAESKEELKIFLMKMKEESEKAGVKSHSKKDHGIQSYHFMANRWGTNGNSEKLYFLGLQNHYGWWLQPWNLKMLAPWKKSYNKPRQCIKKQKYHFANKSLYRES